MGRETKSNKRTTRACQSMSKSSNTNWIIGTGYPLNKHEILTPDYARSCDRPRTVTTGQSELGWDLMVSHNGNGRTHSRLPKATKRFVVVTSMGGYNSAGHRQTAP